MKRFRNKRDGFFVDVGANSGVDQSNTLLLEKEFAWRGILIEPIPELAQMAARNRPAASVEQVVLCLWQTAPLGISSNG
jgi:hypothetical protein